MLILFSELNVYIWWYLRKAEIIHYSMIATNFISVHIGPQISLSSPYSPSQFYGGGHIGFKMAADVEIEVANSLFLKSDIYGAFVSIFMLASLTARFFTLLLHY